MTTDVRHGQRTHGEPRQPEGTRLDGDRMVEQVTRAMEWFSIGLGTAQLAAPRTVARLVGVDDRAGSEALMRGAGLRELVSAAGMQRRDPADALWARVAGDTMDLTMLAAALASTRDRTRRRRTAAATASVVAVTAVDAVAAARRRRAGRHGSSIARTVRVATTVRKTPDEVYAYWRDLENLPTFMAHLEEVQVKSVTTSHWVARAPGGGVVEWDAETVADLPGELIAWRSLEGADVDNTGRVRFTRAPGDRGTEVVAEVSFTPPFGAAGVALAKVFGEEPSQQLADDLRRFKQLVETGEVARSAGSPAGPAAGQAVGQAAGQRPAAPPLTSDST